MTLVPNALLQEEIKTQACRPATCTIHHPDGSVVKNVKFRGPCCCPNQKMVGRPRNEVVDAVHESGYEIVMEESPEKTVLRTRYN